MKKIYLTSLIILATLSGLFSQGTYEDYQRAEKFLHFNVDKLVQNLYLNPNWIDNTNNFWFKTELETGYRFMLVLPEENKVSQAFNHQKLANALSKELNKNINPDSLPFSKIKFKDNLKTVTFKLDSLNFKFDVKKNI